MAAPNSTLTPNDSDQDEKYNPAAQEFAREFENRGTLTNEELANQRIGFNRGDSQSQVQGNEKRAATDTTPGKAAINAAASTAAAVGPAGRVTSAAIKLIGKIKTKKGGAGAAIAAVLIGLLFLGISLLAPSLLVIQVKEALTEKFNDVATAIDERNTLIVQKKMGQATTGCTVKIQCRYKGMSQKQIDRIERTGVKVEVSGDKNAFGRHRVNALVTPEGIRLTADNYRSVLRSNPVALGHMKRAFNPKYTAYSSKAFTALSRKLNIDKRAKVTGVTTEELDKSMSNSIDGEEVDENGNRKKIGQSDIREENGKFYGQDGKEINADQAKAIQDQNAEFNRLAEEVRGSGKKAAISAVKSGTLIGISGGIATVDGFCTGYYLIQMVGYGAKLIESREFIRYAWTIVNTADMQKASDATAKASEYVGKKMTTPNEYGEQFTDSYGYKYAALNHTALPTDASDEATNVRRASIMQFAAGGGIGGSLLNFNQQLNQMTNNSPQTVCGIVKNPLTQIGIVIAGVGLAIGTGGGSIGTGAIAAAAVGVTLGVVIGATVPILQNMAASETVNENTVGGDSGNATVSGMGALNAQNAQAHGLSPLTNDNVLAYTQHNKQVAARNNAADQSQADPFDIYNPSSDLFAVALTLSNQLTTIKKNSIGSSATILTNSIASIFRSTANAADPMAEYDICTDPEYMAKNYAADPFCNIRYGLSDQELVLDPEDTVNWMYNNDHIDEDGRPASNEFESYIADCINRDLPIGSTGPEGQGNDGSKCNNQDQQNQYFRIYYLDTIINDDLDEEDTFGLDLTAATPSAGAPSAIGTPEDVVTKGDGFTLADGKDYSGIACADGTKTLGTYTHPVANYKLQLCEINGIDVASIISASTKQMMDAAAADGIKFTGGGFRSYEEQLALRRTNGCPDPINSPSSACSPATAKPGFSQHERGLALDLQWNGNTLCFPRASSSCTGNKAFNWLVNNASRFNFYNLPREAWHWSTSGT